MEEREQPQEKLSFEEAVQQLEAVVERLESGEASLQESMELFERGVNLAAICSEQLNAAEGRLQILLEKQEGIVRESFEAGEANRE